MGNYKIFLVRVGALLCIAFTANVQGESQVEAEFFNLAGKLRYGDACSWEAEEKRQLFASTLLRFGTDKEKLTAVTNEYAKELVRDGKPLCSATSLTVCNKETKTCECGDPGKVVFMGQEEGTNGYVLETSEDGQQKCRWATNTGCAPVDYIEKVTTGLPKGMQESKCQDGTSCTTTQGSRSSCKFRDLLLYAIVNRRTDVKSISQDLFTGKVCTCQSNSGIELSHDEAEYGANSNFGRMKRFAHVKQVNPSIEAAIAAGLISPFVGNQ